LRDLSFYGVVLFVKNNLNDDELRRVLQTWKVDPKIPPNFARDVWERIASREGASAGSRWWVGLREAFEPLGAARLALTAATLGLVLGGFTGAMKAQQENSQFQHQLAIKYVRSIDPYLRISSL
jgi:hypothetical protein